jgi:hypothetical protein
VQWNFEKFLVTRDGGVAARFASAAAPDSPEIIEAVQAALNEPGPNRRPRSYRFCGMKPHLAAEIIQNGDRFWPARQDC